MLRECATAGLVAPHVFDDLQLIKQAQARGELRGFRYVRVVRDADGTRRVVCADHARPEKPGQSPAGFLPALTSAQRQRRLEQLTRELALDREGRLARAEREVEEAMALRRGASTHFSVEVYRRRPVSYQELGAMNNATFWPGGAR
jgi:hypothetical protein